MHRVPPVPRPVRTSAPRPATVDGTGPRGRRADVLFPNGERAEAWYRVIDVARLQPSHLVAPARNRAGDVVVRPNPERNAVRNARAYGGRPGRRAAELVHAHMQAGRLEPAHLLDGTSFVATGPPVVSLHVPGAEGHALVVAGNHRAMVLRGAAAASAEDGHGAFAAYRRALLEQITARPDLGIPPAAAEALAHPVLVRELVGAGAADVARLEALNRVSDWAPGKAMDPVSLAGAMADGLRGAPGAHAHLAATFGDQPDQTLAAYLNGADAVRLVARLEEEGAVSPLLGAALVHPKTGRLSAHARHHLTQMLYAVALDDPDALDVVSEEYLRRIEPALPVLVAAPATPAWRFLRATLRAALAHFHREHDADALGRLVQQMRFFDEPDPRVRRLAELLHARGGREFAARLRAWRTTVDGPDARPAPPGPPPADPGPDLFGNAPAPTAADPGTATSTATDAATDAATNATTEAQAAERATRRAAEAFDAEFGDAGLPAPTVHGLEWMLTQLRNDPALATNHLRVAVPDALWREFAPRLAPPPAAPRRGGPTPTDDRGRVAGVAFLIRHGVPWSGLYRWWPHLPQHRPDGTGVPRWQAGSYSVCADRLARWRADENGPWEALCARLRIDQPARS